MPAEHADCQSQQNIEWPQQMTKRIKRLNLKEREKKNALHIFLFFFFWNKTLCAHRFFFSGRILTFVIPSNPSIVRRDWLFRVVQRSQQTRFFYFIVDTWLPKKHASFGAKKEERYFILEHAYNQTLRTTYRSNGMGKLGMRLEPRSHVIRYKRRYAVPARGVVCGTVLSY